MDRSRETRSQLSFEFTYAYYGSIMRAIRDNFDARRLSETAGILESLERPTLMVRHDLDISLEKALRLAEIENEYDIRATYTVLNDSPLYRLEEPNSRNLIMKLVDLGHEIGLHFDLNRCEREDGVGIDGVAEKISDACVQLEAVLGGPVHVISFHRPMQHFLSGPLIVCDRINAYARELMECYISDSKGRWRYGDPLGHLTSLDEPLVQLLIHPIWWGERHLSPGARLREFVEKETDGSSTDETVAFESVVASLVPSVRWRE